MLTTSGASEPATRSSSSPQPAGFLASMSRARTSPNERTVKRPATSSTPSMAARACRASTPDASAATAAINALDWLNRPGNDSRTGALRPSAHSPRAVPSAAITRVASGSGRAKPQLAQDQPPSVNAMRPSQEGQPTASCCQRSPAPTQCTSRATPAPHTTRGSSALATTWVCGAAASAARQLPAIMRTSLVRSS